MPDHGPDPGAGAAAILARGAARGNPVEEFGPVWSSARLRLSRASWQATDLQPFLNAAVPYVSTSSGRLSEDAVEVALAALPERPALHILELGAGSGVFARLFLDHLRRRAPAVYAESRYLVTDGSASILDAQHRSGIHQPHAERIERHRLDLSAPWPDLGKFDLILGTYILDSLPFDFLALNDLATWRRETRAMLPEDQGPMAERLRAALVDGTPEALRPYVASGPLLTAHTRHVPLRRVDLPHAHRLPSDTQGETLPYIHGYGALDCIDACIASLSDGGLAIFSDYGHIVPYGARETPEFQTYGTSIATGVNFPQIEAAYAGTAGLAVLKPDEEQGHLFTRVFQLNGTVDISDLVADLYGAKRYLALKVTVDAARELLRGRLYEGARKYYAMALDQQPRNWALMQEIASILHLANAEPAEALDMCSLGLELNPMSPDLWRVKAEAHLACDAPELARAAIDRAVALAPENVEAHNVLARVLLRQGDLGAGLQAVATGLTHDHEGDSREALMDAQSRILAEIARRQLSVLLAASNPFRAMDPLPNGPATTA